MKQRRPDEDSPELLTRGLQNAVQSSRALAGEPIAAHRSERVPHSRPAVHREAHAFANVPGRSQGRQSSPSLSPGVYSGDAFLGATAIQLDALDAALVQFRLNALERSGQDVHSVAAQGMAGGGGALPFGAEIQHAFGRHDVSGIRAHTGGQASEAARRLGAHAYASGNNIVLGGRQDLHTVAHEAAHVIQQRHGVALKDGVGRVGDRYEQHADAVADLVVQGASAEGLLDTMAGSGAGAQATITAVQMDYNGDLAQARRDGAPAVEAEFVALFNREFATILHTFHRQREPAPGQGTGGGGQAQEEQEEETTVSPAAAGGRLGTVDSRIGEASGDGLTWADVQVHFPSPSMRRQLAQYCRDHMIPSNLFTGAPPTASQRLLMASKMLAEGRYEPGSAEEERQQALRTRDAGDGAPQADAQQGEGDEEDGGPDAQPDAQRVHARNCGHWVRLVRHYAGVSDGGGTGVDGQFDHNNRLVLGSARHSRRAAHASRSATVESMAEELGVTIGAQVPAGVRRTAIIKGLRFAEFNFQDGDWLYVMNGGTQHSVIFSHWAGEGESGQVTFPRAGGDHSVALPIQYRRAIVFSQGRVRRGGTEDEYVLGDFNAQVGSNQVKSVTQVNRTEEDAGPATTPADIARPGSVLRDRNNRAFVRRHRPEGAGDFVPERMCNWLRGPNDTLIAQLYERASMTQIDLLKRTNDSQDLGQMIRLNERLNVWVTNAQHLDGAEVDERGRNGGRGRVLAPEEVRSEQEAADRPIAHARPGGPQNEFERSQRASLDRAKHTLEVFELRRDVETQRVTALANLEEVRSARQRASRAQQNDLRVRQTHLRAHLLGLDRQATELAGQDWPADAQPGQHRHPRPYRPDLARLDRERFEAERTVRSHEDDDGYEMSSPGGRQTFLGQRQRGDDGGLTQRGGRAVVRLQRVRGEDGRLHDPTPRRDSRNREDLLQEPRTTGRLENLRPQPQDWSEFYGEASS